MPEESSLPLGREQESTLTDILITAYDLRPTEISRIAAGTATDNFRVTDEAGDQWFAKVYRDRGALEREREEVELARFARAGRVPVPLVRRTRGGEVIATSGRLPLSVWEFVADAETAEGGLVDQRWPAVGAMLGRLHRRLADHPAAAPTLRRASDLCDLGRSRDSYESLITAYGRRGRLDGFEAWALDTARERLEVLDRVAAILRRLPALTWQIVHGDLAAPNLLLRGDEVAAVIDFQPPVPRSVSWEIARIGCDPRTVLLGDQWITGLPELVASYRDEHPAARSEDLAAVVAVGCAYTLASTYPLAEPLKHDRELDASLQAYGRARHEAALVLLGRLDEPRVARQR